MIAKQKDPYFSTARDHYVLLSAVRSDRRRTGARDTGHHTVLSQSVCRDPQGLAEYERLFTARWGFRISRKSNFRPFLF